MEKHKYFVNKNAQANGDHEVHRPGCSFFPDAENREYLGEFHNCKYAVIEARFRKYKANGCFYCVKECHTQ